MKVFVFLCVVGAAFAVREPDVYTCLDRPDPGMCLAYVPSYYYDPETETCKKFIYGGCQGNGNRYRTEEDCLKHCKGIQVEQKASNADVCSMEKEPGMCFGYFPRFYYDKESQECKKFIYGGCQGNANNFRTLEECNAACPVQDAVLNSPDCDKDAEPGRCKAFIRRFYYDAKNGECKEFIYGGCGGNKNNFRTEEECRSSCGALMSPSACEQEKVVGPCRAAFQRYFYNKETGKCEFFLYGGCHGNDNNFESQGDCEAVCVPRAPSKCSLEADGGMCRGYFPMYFFNSKAGKCEEFIYGGCGGNDNRFGTEEECQEACSD